MTTKRASQISRSGLLCCVRVLQYALHANTQGTMELTRVSITNPLNSILQQLLLCH